MTMGFQSKLRRYLIILERARERPTLAELKAHLEGHGFKLSTRTLQRDIEQIRADLGLELVYDRPSNTYHLPEGSDDRAALLPLLERAVLGDLLGANGEAIRSTAPYVRMEHKGYLLGLRHWDVLLRAIRDRHEVLITYRHAVQVPNEVFRMRPCLLKEYRGRWFLLGTAKGYTHPIGLGLDRIAAVKLTTEHFPARERLNVELFYDPVIGMDTSAPQPIPVQLWFTALQGQYVKALPLHSSQRVVREDAEGVTVSLFVVPNFEFRRELLGFGPRVRILEPAWLATEIRHEHLSAAY
jgi:predicted DNA-binding transcriptional regulator YafY